MMKKVLWGVLILLTNLNLNAITKPIYGYFISANNDTVDCKFDIPFYKTKSGELKLEFRNIQYKIKAKTKDGTKYKIDPVNFNGFGFAYNYHQFNYISFNNTVNSKGDKIFLRVDVEGKLKLLSHFVNIPIITPYYSPIQVQVEDVRYRRHYIQIENGDVIKYNKSFFKTGFSKIISDHQELAGKIGKRDYEYDNLMRIILEYNEFFEGSKL